MKKTMLVVLVVALFALVAFSAVLAADERSASQSASLSGANEVPVLGDTDGFGNSGITVNSGRREICYFIHVQNITLPAAAAHIHLGAAGVAGPVLVTLNAPDASGVSSGCVSGVDNMIIRGLRQNPSNYYVNVHTSDFPGGAVRGQLN